MKITFDVDPRTASLPSRERGLKFVQEFCRNFQKIVAPFAGAWIEIGLVRPPVRAGRVAPFAGAWIEMGRSE